ncbi:hypothetical protein [Streptomyces narbonensis]|uniref:hypothetical protein n=1 Tax=Streptomyces narbonensis TaxID=67333 RepID=UPI0033FF37BA
MSGGGGWWVLVEARVYGDWELARSVPVDGGRDRAVAAARELARTCTPSGSVTEEPEAYGRRVFRVGESDWLVEMGASYWNDESRESRTTTTHLRISVAELEYAHDTPAAEPPPKGVLRRVFGRDRAAHEGS